MGMDLRLSHQNTSARLGTGMAGLLGAGIKPWVFHHGGVGDSGLEHGRNLDLNTW